MAVELYIEDKQVDLIGDESISIDYAVSKIADFQKKSGALSIEFAVPKTATNRAIFENPDSVTSLSTIPYTKLKARLFVDGIQQRITICSFQSSKDNYNIRLYGDEVGFFELIKNGKLTDLDFSAFDYYHMLSEVVANRANTEICYPVIWNFETTPSVGVSDIRYHPPAFSVEYLLERICEYYGYTLTNTIKDRYNYPSQLLILPFTGEEWKRDTNGERYNCTFYGDTATATTPIIDRVNFDTLLSGDTNYFNPSIYSGWNGYVVLNDKITFNYTLDITVDVTADFAPLMLDLRIRVISGSLLLQSYIVPYSSVSVGNNSYTITGTASVTPNASFDDSNAIFVDIFPTNDTINNLLTVSLVDATIEISDCVITEATDVNRDLSTSFTSRQYCTINSITPEIKMSDLFKAYCQIFCGLLQVNESDKSVSVVPFDVIQNNTTDAYDWSDKLDFTDKPEIRYSLDNYGQVNTLDWKYDDTAKELNRFVTDYAKGTIEIDNSNLPDEYKFIEVDFSATRMITTGGVTICQISVWDGSLDFLGAVDKRLIFMRFQNVSFNYSDGTSTSLQTTDIPLTHFIKSGESYNLGFGDNLIDKFFQTISDILDKTKQVTCDVRLNALDINNLDFTRPVYISHFNSYFYISAVKGYTPTNNESTTVELVKLF
jgi:hypothetical protein